MELDRQREAFRKRGLNVVAVTYDSAALLKHFAERTKIGFPLLGDPESKLIRAFDILNTEFPPGHFAHGVPHPGTYIIDAKGIVQAKFFERDYRERFTAGNILTRYFSDASGAAYSTVETRHLKLTASLSDAAIPVNSRVSLILDVELKPRMHVYAPGVEGYIPIEWRIGESPLFRVHDPEFPASEKMHLPAINETVPVYHGRFRIRRDVTLASAKELAALLKSGEPLTIEGSFRYQACDDTQCFVPQTVPLKWSIKVVDQDRQRAPVELRRPQ